MSTETPEERELRKDWERQQRRQWTCECGQPDELGLNHRYIWEGGCIPTRVKKPYVKPRVGFRCVFHWPKFYRYRVADHGFRVGRNRYVGDPGLPSAWIGQSIVAGAWAYCVRWAKIRNVYERGGRMFGKDQT